MDKEDFCESPNYLGPYSVSQVQGLLAEYCELNPTLTDYIKEEESKIISLCYSHREKLGLRHVEFVFLDCNGEDCRLGCPLLKT